MTNESTACEAATFTAYFAHLFEYDRWANRRVLETMATLGDRLPQRPVDRLSHLLICQELWIARLSGKELPTEIFPTWPLDELQRRAPVIFESMERCIAGLSEQDLHELIGYTSMEGKPLRTSYAHALTQLYGHGCYHRGQIACELNPLLPEPITTDYIYFVTQTR